MISTIQRVNSASIIIDKKTTAEIKRGILALVCIEKDDDNNSFIKMADKILKYRIFEDKLKKMNLSLLDIKGEIILVPQFTLAANTNKGNRPGFSNSCPPNLANEKFEEFKKIFKNSYQKVQFGIFGVDMQVSLINDGPVTFNLKV